jgi:poly(A) polymerase
MLDAGIWAPVLPELRADRLAALASTIVTESAAGMAPAWQRRLAVLLPVDAVTAVTARLRLSNADRERIAAAVVPDVMPRDAILWRDGAEAVADRLLIAGDAAGALAALAWERPKLPASGRDIIARGVAPGREVAVRLGAFERAWVAAGFPDDAGSVSALLDTAARQ